MRNIVWRDTLAAIDGTDAIPLDLSNTGLYDPSLFGLETRQLRSEIDGKERNMGPARNFSRGYTLMRIQSFEWVVLICN